jgi:hypothetical protein
MSLADDREAKPPGGELQFDHAEFLAPPSAMTCGVCAQPFAEAYYELGKKVVCTTCRDRIVTSLTGGSGLWRFLRAALFGSLAAVAGTALYFLVLAMTGYEVGLIAIVVGVMVGAAVRKGARYRGGLAYQMLAVYLTYTAIVASYVPIFLGESKKRAEEKPAAVAAASAAQPPGAEKEVPDAAKPAQPGAPLQPKDAPARKLGIGGTVLVLILGLIVLLAVAYAAPFLAGAQNIIGLVIIFFGLLQAWRMNKKIHLQINGPFRVGQGPPPLEEAPAHA